MPSKVPEKRTLYLEAPSENDSAIVVRGHNAGQIAPLVVTEDVTTGVRTALGGGGGGPSPGQELAYAEIVAQATSVAVSAVTAVSKIVLPSYTFDGATKVAITFSTNYLTNSGGSQSIVDIWEDNAAVDLGVIARNDGATFKTCQRTVYVTPPAGPRIYSARLWVTAGTGTIDAGAGILAAYLRMTRA